MLPFELTSARRPTVSGRDNQFAFVVPTEKPPTAKQKVPGEDDHRVRHHVVEIRERFVTAQSNAIHHAVHDDTSGGDR